MTKKYPPLPNIDTIDIRLLRVFAAVVRNRGFSAAQMELNVNQPTISAHMSQLEVRLGLRLCHRGRGGFELTEHGEQVYEAVRSLFNAIEIFKTDVGSFKGQLVGEIHIGMTDALITNPDFKLPAIIEKFNRAAPEIRLHLHKKSPNALHRNIVEETLNFAISPFFQDSTAINDLFLFEEAQMMYCGRGHSLFDVEQESITIEQLNSMAYVTRDYTHNEGPMDLSHLNTTSLSGDMECIASLILSGNYIGYLPQHYAKQWVDKNQMKVILAKESTYNSRFNLLFKRTKLNLATKLFLSIFKTEYNLL